MKKLEGLMKIRCIFSFNNQKAFTLMEVLISMVVIAFMAMVVFTAMSSSWKRSIFSNRSLVAGHLIEREIEKMRMNIDRNPDNNFPPVSNTITENGVTLTWTIADAKRPTDNATLANVRQCNFVAKWGSGKTDSMMVSTYLSKMF
jgi:prepilin-type N-terminal cleavage/methylation domain-containing protein